MIWAMPAIYVANISWVAGASTARCPARAFSPVQIARLRALACIFTRCLATFWRRLLVRCSCDPFRSNCLFSYAVAISRPNTAENELSRWNALSLPV